MIVSIGIDPDVHNCAFARIVEVEGKIENIQVYVVRQKEGRAREAALALIQQTAFDDAVNGDFAYRTPEVLTVEGQDVRYTGATTRANPQDVCNLSLISGAAIGLSVANKTYCPMPHQWKRSVRKDIKQKRILKKLGIEYTMRGGKSPYPVPVDFEKYCIGKVNAGDWKDLTDALGLAMWGLEKYKMEHQ